MKNLRKKSRSFLTRKQALKRSEEDQINHFDWRCDCTKKESWKITGLCELCENQLDVPLKFWHNNASAHIGYICNDCYHLKGYSDRGIISVKGYMIYFGPALNKN